MIESSMPPNNAIRGETWRDSGNAERLSLAARDCRYSTENTLSSSDCSALRSLSG